MKSLILMRHAKTETPTSGLEDFDRQLTPRGIKNTPEAAAVLNRLEWHPDLILSSTARRTRQTAELLTKHLRKTCPVEFRDDLYLPSPNQLHDCILQQAPAVNRLMVVVHEPSISSLIAHWTGKYISVVTASMTTFEFDVSEWRQLSSDHLQSVDHYSRHQWNGIRVMER